MWIIRADGNARIGAGHLMRCLTIAEAADREVLFLTADEESAALVRGRGFAAGVLHTDYRQPETELVPARETAGGTGTPADADGACAWDCFLRTAGHTILVDSYYVTDHYLQQLQTYGRVFLMDDLQNHAYPVDGVINYNVFADGALYERLYAGKSVRRILGASYVPLRAQFQKTAYVPRETVRDVLLTTGGGDADNIAGAILDAVYDPQITFHVLVGRFNPHFADWTARAARQTNIRICYDVQDMVQLMAQCDLAITAGGSTVYELCAVGVPLICFAYAENQEALAAYLRETDTAGSAGAWHREREACLAQIRQCFQTLREDSGARERYSARERALVDGLGARRLAQALFAETEESDGES